MNDGTWLVEDDVTPQRRSKGTRHGQRADDELDDAARIELMSAISAGLAHDLNSPLTALVLQLQEMARDLFVAERMAGGADGRSAFDACRASLVALEETTDFLRRLVHDFLRACGGPSTRTGATMARAAVSAAVRLTRTLVCERATVEVAVPADLVVAVDDGTVIRLLMHLIINAADAFTTRQALASRIRVSGRRAPSGVAIDVADNGPGVPEEVRPRLFQPFTTSKAGGLGLGLVVARSLARRAGGDVELVTTGPEGTVFRLTLPSMRD
jgi:C4-dicarboxylate-specific signal transduction histidine kinase